MGNKKPYTPNARITSALRQLWLRSRERAAALKRDNYTCQSCNVKQSTRKGHEQKVVVHHNKGVKWDEIREYIRKELLVNEKDLTTLCPKCHDLIHRLDE